MTFQEIVDRIAERLNIPASQTASLARIGRSVNDAYREISTSIGLDLSRRSVSVTASTSLGVQTVTFNSIEKIERLIDDTSGTIRVIPEVHFDQIRVLNPAASDVVGKWAVQSWTGTSVTIRLDVLPQTVFTLKADGFSTAATLSGSDVPAFPESFHDIIIDRVLADEYFKQEKVTLSDRAAQRFEKRLSDLRMWRATSITKLTRQAETRLSQFGSTTAGSGGGGSAPSGGTSWTQTGLITFDRDPSAPFAVTSGSAMVANLDAERLGGLTLAQLIASIDAVDGPASSADNAIARFDGTTGNTIQNSGITIADGATGTLSGSNSGDVTLAGSPDYITISGQVITRALVNLQTHITSRLQYANFIAATTGSVVVGRRSGSSGDFEQVSLGAGLTMSNGGVLDTTANANTQTANTVYAGPSSGGAATPTFRALTVNDLPTAGEWLGEDVQVSAGGGTEQFKLGGIIDSDDTQFALASGAEAVMRTYTIPANTFNANGRTIVFKAWGTLAADTDNKIIRVRFTNISGTIILQVSQNASAYVAFETELIITRIASNSQRVIGKGTFYTGLGGGASPSATLNVTTSTQTDTSAITVVLTGEGVNANDIVYEASVVEMHN